MKITYTMTEKLTCKLLPLFQNEQDYCLINSNIGNHFSCFCFCHGSKNGFVTFKNQKVSFEELGSLIRFKLGLSDENLTVIVYCCYGAYQTPYYSNNTIVKSGFNNKEPLEVSLESVNNHYICTLTAEN